MNFEIYCYIFNRAIYLYCILHISLGIIFFIMRTVSILVSLVSLGIKSLIKFFSIQIIKAFLIHPEKRGKHSSHDYNSVCMPFQPVYFLIFHFTPLLICNIQQDLSYIFRYLCFLFLEFPYILYFPS